MHSAISDVILEDLVTGNHSIHISMLMSRSLINSWCLTVCAWFRQEICWATCPLCRCCTVTQCSQTHWLMPNYNTACINQTLSDWLGEDELFDHIPPFTLTPLLPLSTALGNYSDHTHYHFREGQVIFYESSEEKCREYRHKVHLDHALTPINSFSNESLNHILNWFTQNTWFIHSGM